MTLADPDAAFNHQAIAPSDEQAIEAFMAPVPATRRTLADLIMSKIKDRQTEIASQMSGERRRL